MSDDPAKPPRFPIVGALLCAACLGAAVWTWMRYSYVWDMTLAEYRRSPRRVTGGRWDAWPCNAYVRVGGVLQPGPVVGDDRPGRLFFYSFLTSRYDPRSSSVLVASHNRSDLVVNSLQFQLVCGRVRGKPHGILHLYIDAHRLHGASIAGLVVGAMGVFVFTVALRHWWTLAAHVGQ